MPIISDGNNLIGDEVTDEHTVLGKTMHSGSYHLSGTHSGNILLINSSDMTTQLSAPGGGSFTISPHIGVFENNEGVQPTIAISRADDTKQQGGVFSVGRASPTGSVGPGDVMGAFQVMGHDGTDYVLGAQIRFAVDHAVSTDHMPTQIEFMTNPGDGTTVWPETRMTISSDGNVGIGTVSHSEKLSVMGDTKLQGGVQVDGMVGVGTASPTSLLTLNGAQPKLTFRENDSDRAEISINDSDNLVITNQSINKYVVFKTNDAGAIREGFRIGGVTPEVVVNEGSDSLVDFRVESDNNTHMLFVDGGNDRIGIGTNNPDELFDVAGKVRIDSNGMIAMAENTSNPSTETGYAHIYAKDGGATEVYVQDSNGNSTKISPHNPEGEWEYFSKNSKTGKVVKINMEKMIKRLEEITGESFMEEWYEDPTE